MSFHILVTLTTCNGELFSPWIQSIAGVKKTKNHFN